jgi:hypothetical protein
MEKATEFMFWAYFSYNFKGPCLIGSKGATEERRLAEDKIAGWNRLLEPEYQRRWEAARSLLLLSRNRQQCRRPAELRFTKVNGKLVREAKREGMDWYRYLMNIVLPKIFPFAERCKELCPDTIVQEHRAGPHAHQIQGLFYNVFKIERLLWPGN